MGEHDQHHDPLGVDRRHRFTSTLHLAVHAKVAANPHWWDLVDDNLDHRHGRADTDGWLDAYAPWPWVQDALRDWDVIARDRDLDRFRWVATDRSSHANEMRRTGVDGHIITSEERWWALEAAGLARGSVRVVDGVLEQAATGITWDTAALDLTGIRHVGHASALDLLEDDLGSAGSAGRWLVERVRRGTFGLTRYVTDNLHRQLAAGTSEHLGAFVDEPLSGRRGGSALRSTFVHGTVYLETRPSQERALAAAAMLLAHDFYDVDGEQIAVAVMNGVLAAEGFAPVPMSQLDQARLREAATAMRSSGDGTLLMRLLGDAGTIAT